MEFLSLKHVRRLFQLGKSPLILRNYAFQEYAWENRQILGGKATQELSKNTKNIGTGERFQLKNTWQSTHKLRTKPPKVLKDARKILSPLHPAIRSALCQTANLT